MHPFLVIPKMDRDEQRILTGLKHKIKKKKEKKGNALNIKQQVDTNLSS
jgi:hypothetical protein